MKFNVIIPARYASSRLPGKPLELIHGIPMIEHVIMRSLASGANRVVVATDDSTIADAVRTMSAEVCMTGRHHTTGTERIVEAIDRLGLQDDEIVINVQGDEPLIRPGCISSLAKFFALSQNEVATLAAPVSSQHDATNPNVVKVVLDQDDNALYFSRAPIPWNRDSPYDYSTNSQSPVLRHIGLYAHRAGFLRKYAKWETVALERIEALEQLRILWHGYKISVLVVNEEANLSVDTRDDLERARSLSKEAFQLDEEI